MADSGLWPWGEGYWRNVSFLQRLLCAAEVIIFLIIYTFVLMKRFSGLALQDLNRGKEMVVNLTSQQ